MRVHLLPLLRWRMARHRLWPPRAGRWVLAAAFAALGLLFLVGDFVFFRRIFQNVLATEEVPAVLLTAVCAKLMGLVLLTTFSLVLFSAAVSALSFLYLDEDLAFLLPLPIGRRSLLGYRALEAAVNACYMVALLLAPVVAAYASLFPFRPGVVALGLAGLVLYLAAPSAWGVMVTAALARFFPARRLHQLLTVLSVVLVCLLVVLFRLARPEALLNPLSSPETLEILKSIRMPRESALPSTWLAEVVVRGSEGLWARALPAFGKLAALAAASLAAMALVLKLLHRRGYGRAQEQGTAAPGAPRNRVGTALLTLAVSLAPAGRSGRALLARDALLFFRDPTQWGQLIILGALAVVYLFNVRYMPTELAVFKVAVAFWNLATLGLIVSAVAGRFAFTAVGGEGRAYFASRVLPLSIGSYLWAKFLFTAVPLTALSTLTLYGSNRFLGVTGEALAYTVYLSVAASLALSALALGMGCVEPVFDNRNPAKAVMSTWGLTYMFLSLFYVGVVLVVSARPVARHYAHLLGRGPGADYLPAVLAVGGLSAAIIAGSFLFAARRLKGLEPA